MISDELDLFYDTGDFAVRCTRSRPGEDDATFSGLLSTLDDERFGGQVMAGVHQLQYPTAAAGLQTDDTLVTQALDAAGAPVGDARTWTVLRTPDRVVDGAESIALLTPEADL
jgi:hypothetical protein